MTERVFIGVGSNLDDPFQQVQAAIEAMKIIPQTVFINHASLIESTPLGPQDQPNFVNTVVELQTMLEPESLLDHLQAIENAQGRVRKKERWGPRTIDLDILLFGERVINTPRLTVPHYDMHNREFVLKPLAELQ